MLIRTKILPYQAIVGFNPKKCGETVELFFTKMFGDMTRNQFLSQVKSPDWLVQNSILHGKINYCKIQWIGLRENLQETIDFPSKYGVNQSIEKSHFWRAEFSGETHSSEQRRL